MYKYMRNMREAAQVRDGNFTPYYEIQYKLVIVLHLGTYHRVSLHMHTAADAYCCCYR